VIFILQSSTSPVAPEWTIEDDSNGSIARDRFVRLGVILVGGEEMRNFEHTLMIRLIS
jgi:hypothetical protein